MGRFRGMLHKISNYIKTKVNMALTFVVLVAIATISFAQDLSGNYEKVSGSVFVVNTLEDYDVGLKGTFSDDSPFKSLEDLPNDMPTPRSLGKGTGFLISKEGYVVTNDHVVNVGNTYVLVDQDGNQFDATLVGTDKFTDLAVLKIDKPEKLKERTILEFGEDPKVGHPVYIIGHPINMSFILSTGHVTSVDSRKQKFSKFIQTDAVVNKGNSGGPMFNFDNQVVGVVTALVSPTGYYIGYGYATPPSVATAIVEELVSKGYIWRPVIGFSILDIKEETSRFIPEQYRNSVGVYVAEVQPQSAALEAGIQIGDIVITFNGIPATVESMIDQINKMSEQDTIKLKILRKSSSGDKTIELELKAKNRE